MLTYAQVLRTVKEAQEKRDGSRFTNTKVQILTLYYTDSKDRQGGKGKKGQGTSGAGLRTRVLERREKRERERERERERARARASARESHG
jgi:hypothetical protein